MCMTSDLHVLMSCVIWWLRILIMVERKIYVFGLSWDLYSLSLSLLSLSLRVSFRLFRTFEFFLILYQEPPFLGKGLEFFHYTGNFHCLTSLLPYRHSAPSLISLIIYHFHALFFTSPYYRPYQTRR